LAGSKRINNKLIFYIFCTLIVLVACFGLVSLLTAKNSFSNDPEEKWDGVTVSSSFSAGNGTIDNPYIIKSGADFAYFREALGSENANLYNDKYYELGCNLNLDNHEINTISGTFSGVFNGAGYSIKNFKITSSYVNDNYNYYGIFSVIDSGVFINTNLYNVVVSPSSSTLKYKLGTVAGEVIGKSKITNISIVSSYVDLENITDTNDNILAGVIGSVSSESDFYNIYANLEFNITNILTVGKIGYTVECDTDNIVTNIKSNSLFNDTNSNYINSSSKHTNQYSYEDPNFINNSNNTMVSSSDLLSLLDNNLDNDYYWDIDGSILTIKRNDDTSNLPMITTFSFSANQSIVIHDSGVLDDTLYVNDLVADYNNYIGLNYTDFSSTGTLPTGEDQNIYNSNNLVKIYAKYNGTSIYDSSYTGYIGLDSDLLQSNLIYYKYYPVVDGYVTFELIDNPYGNRPDDLAFNGWITDYPGAYIYLDTDTYVRYVKIPVDDVSQVISIEFVASWVSATTYEITSSNTSWDTVNNSLNSVEMIQLSSRIPVYDVDMTQYYLSGTVNRRSSYPSGSYNQYGNSLSGRCNNWGGCTYYYHPTDSDYNSNLTYYELSSGYMQVFVPTASGYEENPLFPTGTTSAGFFKQVTVSNSSSIIGYYDNSGNYLTGTCTNSSGCTYYEYLQYYDSNGNENIINLDDTYYYLVTRDTNVVVLRTSYTSSLSNSKPFTLTSINNGVDYRDSATYTIRNSYISAGADLRIENITLTSNRDYSNTSPTSSSSSSSYIYGNWYNLKIGKGIRQVDDTITAYGVIAGNNSSTGSSGSPNKYRTIVESGFYDTLIATNGAVNDYSESSWWGTSGARIYVDAMAIYGNDYDRVISNNDSLIVYYCASGSWGGSVYGANTTNSIAIHTNIKSGQFGTSKLDYSTGVYIGGRGGGTHYSAREATIEGGWIYNLIGGPLTDSSRNTLNDTYINVKAGSIDLIVGGAGASATYGNRIINLNGGVVNYAVFGGSNGYSGSDSGSYQGTLEGSTFVYVGGSAVVGDDTLISNNTDLFGAESGSVFGIGNGNSDSSKIGTADNSNIVINGNATIKRNVYGGGNYGAVGISASSSTSTDIKVLGGNILGSLYAGGNNNGSGSSSVESTINISVLGGTIGNVYGGSKTKGTVYGNTNVNVLAGNIVNDVYGGGEGNDTFVTKNVNVVIGDNSVTDELIVNGNVYGGSAYGTVNGSSTGTDVSEFSTNVTVNKGTIVQSVFGGGKGDDNYTPYVLGDVTVTINDGNIGNVFGGNDAKGSPNGDDYVYLNGGIIGNSYGGGNNTGQTTTNIYLQGATVNNLFGGSNKSGTVTTTNVYVTSGTVGNVYGGNNIGGNTVTSNVTVTGGTFNGDIYAGGSLADTTTSNASISNVKANDVYAGGERASVTTSNVTCTDTTLNKVFGGSNYSGDVEDSKVIINSSNIDSVYGGNNQGGTTKTTNVSINSGTITNVFGGGDNASSTTSNVEVNSGVITNVYGGGNEAGVDTSNVKINSGTITNLFGGSNRSGDIVDANVIVGDEVVSTPLINVAISSTPVESTWQSSEYATYADVTVTLTNLTDSDISDWKIKLDMPEDVSIYSNWSSTDFTVENGVAEINSVNKYDANNPNKLTANSGTYSFTFAVLTNTSVSDFNISSSVITPVDSSASTSSNINISNLYGGNNEGGVTSSPVVKVNNGVIGNLYGGGNRASVGTTNVTIRDAVVDTVYAGGNAAGVNGDTFLDIDDSTINNNIYGGGNEGVVSGSTDVFVTNSNVLGSAYAGGNGSTAIVSKNTNITIDGKTVIGTESSVAPTSGSVFAGGNAAATGTEVSGGSVATVNIVGGTIYGNVYGGANTSVVYGSTETNIGTSAVNNTNLVEDDIYIKGTVFGGGEANASGSEVYDWTFISVTSAINVNIDGTGYIDNNHTFLMNGSIFGSGNASTSSGVSNINIKNLGTRSDPSRNVSVQRTDNLVIDNSCIELSGIKDRTNEYSDIPYSFNQIKSLVIKNGTVLLLKRNANMLESLYSGVDVDGTLVPATVTIDDSGNYTRNVDNRIYMAPNNNLNVTTNQSATAYGKVTGMTFFGMYNSYSSGSISYGVYDPSVNNGDSADAGDVIVGGSYVLGLHSLNHDITKDGFYSNFLNDEYTLVTTKYIDPTEVGDTGYRWIIGLDAINYTVNLNSSKYSSLGTGNISLMDFSSGDTIFNVVGFNSEGLADGVSLIDPDSVPKIANTAEEANQKLGLAMKAETREWTSYGTTEYLSENNGKYTGTTSYKTDSQALVPSFMFYLYHAKNVTVNQDLGTAVVSIQVLTPINAIEYKVQLVTITVNITASNFQDGDAYDASITYDKRYDMPSATSVNITNQSQFTTYYSLFAYADDFESFYGLNNDYYHALVTDYVLPVGTQITMLDYGVDQDKPEYYYYTVTEDNYQTATNQLAADNEVTYKLSEFIKMGSVSDDNKYSDALNNTKYFTEEYGRVVEEFIFIFDFKETTTTGTHTDNSMLFELRTAEDRTLLSVLGIRQSLMKYSLYDSSNAVLQQTVTPESNYMYYDIAYNIDYSTAIGYDQTEGRESIINTNYESSSMGLNISIVDSSSTQVSSSLLSGTSVVIDQTSYFADSDGVYRIKLTGKVATIKRAISIYADSLLPAGNYTLKITLFASADGRHNSHALESEEVSIPITLVGSDNSIKVTTEDKNKLVDGDEGVNELNLKYNKYIVSYTTVLTNPNVRVSLYKRNTDNKDTTDYTEVDFNSVFSNILSVPSDSSYMAMSTYEKMLKVNAGVSNTLFFNFNDNLTSGTYKLVFKLYDNNQLIDEDYKYVIIKKKVF
jgi:hypothetical protein